MIPGIDTTANLHCLRHTFASWSVLDSLSLPQVGPVLGHRSAQMTLRYTDHVLDAVQGHGERAGAAFARMAREVSRSSDEGTPVAIGYPY